MASKIDRTGLRYGCWTVLQPGAPTRTNKRWLCRCDCGQEQIVCATLLSAGRSTRCVFCSGRVCRARHGAFARQSQEADFWAGVLAADGCVRGKSVTLGFKVEDEPFLLQFRDWVGSTAKVDNRVKKCADGKTWRSSYLTVGSEKIVKDLLRHYGITPQKSRTLKPPKRFSAAFIAGLFMGDGTVGLYKQTGRGQTREVWRVGFCGTPAMMEKICWYFSAFSEARVRCREPWFAMLSYSGRALPATVAKIILANSPFRLERKMLLLEQCVRESRPLSTKP